MVLLVEHIVYGEQSILVDGAKCSIKCVEPREIKSQPKMICFLTWSFILYNIKCLAHIK
jgi:hypothetical protein